jgi:hypothetical protein
MIMLTNAGRLRRPQPDPGNFRTSLKDQRTRRPRHTSQVNQIRCRRLLRRLVPTLPRYCARFLQVS